MAARASTRREAGVTFQLPIKGDLDRVLSHLMHDARHKLMAQVPRVMAEAAQSGLEPGNRVIARIAELGNQIHGAAMDQAKPILLDFIERLELPATEVTSWARPELTQLGDNLMGVVPPNNLPNGPCRF